MKTIDQGPVLVSRDGATARITLNRPEKKNAVTTPMLHTMIRALEGAIADVEVRSIVVSGQGGFFSSGRDTKELSSTEDSGAPVPRVPTPFMRALTLLLESPKPTIASVRGYALGGGQAISLACDFVVAERNARFGNVEMAYGFPAAMNIALLSRHIGRRFALEIAMTGDLYTAERYADMGLVNRLAEPGELESATDQFVGLLNSREPWAVQRTKRTFRAAEATTEQGAMYLGDELNQLLFGAGRQLHSGSGETKEAITSNLEKPKAQ